MNEQFSWIVLFASLSFFYFGLNYSRSGLQLMAGDKMRRLIARMTQNRFKALGLGALITVILQSSSATLLMLISLAATGLLSLTQAFAVILGADIGTTLVVLLLSIKKMADVGLIFIVIGFSLEWIIRGQQKLQYLGRILFGFGMVFYGMKLLTHVTTPLISDSEAHLVFSLFADHPILMLMASIGLTILVQTSAATIGMAIALSVNGVISFQMALPIILGANVGTCFSALIASLSGSINGKRVAVAHLLVKTFGVVMAMPFLEEITMGVTQMVSSAHQWFPGASSEISGEIVLSHLLFNLGLGIVFLPFLSFGVWLVSRLVPEGKDDGEFKAKYLDSKALETPALAFAQAKQEILRIAHLALDLYKGSLTLFEQSSDFMAVAKRVEGDDDKIDKLERDVRFYLAHIGREMLTEEQMTQEMQLLAISNDLEGIGDVISKDLKSLARKKLQGGKIFSEQGWKDIQNMHQQVMDLFHLVLAAMTVPTTDLVHQVLMRGRELEKLEQNLRESHIQRLRDRLPEAFETSSIHLDILGNFKRVVTYLVHIGESTLGI